MTQNSRLPPGFTLVGIVVVIAVLTILVAAIGPSIAAVVQRDRENELIFRGKQIARGIVLFQKRFGRLPTTMKELKDSHPKTLRQLWKEPMCNCDGWQLIFAGTAEAVPPGQSATGGLSHPPTTPGQGNQPPSTYSGLFPPARVTPSPDASAGPAPTPGGFPSIFGGGGKPTTVGPIVGVRSRLHKKGYRQWRDLDYYDEWRFLAGDADNDNRRPVDPNLLRGIKFTPSPTAF